MEKQKQIKRYNTKKRKEQMMFYKIIIASLMLAVVVIGAVGTYTNNTLASEVPYVTVSKETETLEQMVERVAKEEDFKWVGYMKRLIYCESRWDVYALNDNGAYGIDRGLLQWNTKYHPEITNEMAFNPEISVREAMRLIKNGGQKQWSCDHLIK